METSLHTNEVLTAGLPLDKASKALILVHGRGGTAADILQLQQHLLLTDFAVLAPQATQNTWYPYSFLAPPAQNEPWLTAAINSLARVVENVRQNIAADHIYLAGFSQGACLSLEFAARHAQRFGGVIAFTGGLIGDRIYPDNYQGNFAGTPIYIGSSDTDPHVPLTRVYASENILNNMGAIVQTDIFPGMAHTILEPEIAAANRILNSDHSAA